MASGTADADADADGAKSQVKKFDNGAHKKSEISGIPVGAVRATASRQRSS